MKAVVVKLNREPHPNPKADKIFVQKVGDKQVCMNKKDWEGQDFAVHVPPGAIVDTDRPEFSWLKSGEERYHTVAARVIREVESYGLMAPAPAGASEGDDLTEALGVHFS